MPSLDIVSTVDMQTLDNIVNNAKREVSTRYDFRSVHTEIVFDHKDKSIKIATGDEMKIKAIMEILVSQCVRQKIEPKVLDPQKIEAATQNTVRREVRIKEGISREMAQKMVKFIKASGLKVQPAIQDDQVRVVGKQIDDLQTMMQQLREEEWDVPLQFVNMKR
ncbi:MAG: YajQ family cyclic di-GMP-binding protein [Dehalococcoidia bacterium]|nr:YajQ family cyclic di-GMP-binding protein [Dehalococcoidia bacterium]